MRIPFDYMNQEDGTVYIKAITPTLGDEDGAIDEIALEVSPANLNTLLQTTLMAIKQTKDPEQLALARAAFIAHMGKL
jgi:hypothetical protein